MRLLAISILALLLAACGQQVPPDKLSYVGEWQAPNMRLVITRDGTIDYERRQGSTSRHIEAPIQAYEGDNLIVGVAFVKTTFVVKTPPHERDGRWHMVVDGVDLTRVDAGAQLEVERL